MEEIKLQEKYMKRAFSLAKKGAGKVSPNPLVGAVIVKNGRIIAEGYHKGPGTPHAEIVALNIAGKEAEGSDLYVNLEPCAHYGRTPPCVDAVIESKIKRVFISNEDPNPLVNGKSIKKLIENNIQVFTGILEEDGSYLNEIFFKFIKMGIPFIALKSAASLDGKIATSTGESKWITGNKAREDSQKLRNRYDGILTGINTIIEDNPMLTCRLKGGRNPVRIVLDSKLRISPEAQILNMNDSAEKTIIITTRQAEENKIVVIRKKAKVFIIENESIDINQVLKLLSSLKITSILVEGGAKIHGSFIGNNLPDKYYLYYAPILIGGKEAPGFFGGEGFKSLADTPKLNIHNIKSLGKDVRVTLYPEQRR